MKKHRQVDVVIVGAGPVGLFAALALVRRGVSVEIIDSQPHASSHSYALTLHSETLGLLQAYGLLFQVLDGARKVSRIDYFQGTKRTGEIDLAATSLAFPFLAVVEQNHLETVLEQALLKSGVRVGWNHRAAEVREEGDNVHVRVDELEGGVIGYAVAHGEGFVRRSREIAASLVIGADGFNSFVRRSQGIPFPEVGFPEDYAVFQFETVCGECDTVQIVEKDGLVNVRWPIKGNGCRWSFQLAEDEAPPEYLRRKDPSPVQRIDHTAKGPLDEGRLRELLAERAPWCPARVKNEYWNVWVRFERRLAERFGQGRVWLTGDAAHLTSPVGVQSMNVGLAEAHDLSDRMYEVLKGGASLDTFAEYNKERLAEWSFLLGLKGGLEPTPLTDDALLKNREQLLSWLPASGKDLGVFAEAMGFKVSGWTPAPRRRTAELPKAV